MSALIAVADHVPDREIKQRLDKHLSDLKIPSTIEQVYVERKGSTMTISLKYTEWLTLGYGEYQYDLWQFHFNCTASSAY
jgi:hypothetical protein